MAAPRGLYYRARRVEKEESTVFRRSKNSIKQERDVHLIETKERRSKTVRENGLSSFLTISEIIEICFTGQVLSILWKNVFIQTFIKRSIDK